MNVEHRRHLRYSVKEPCTADLEDGEHIGAVVNMSVAGAAVHLDVELDAKLVPDTVVVLRVHRIGGIHTRVVRSLVDVKTAPLRQRTFRVCYAERQ